MSPLQHATLVERTEWRGGTAQDDVCYILNSQERVRRTASRWTLTGSLSGCSCRSHRELTMGIEGRFCAQWGGASCCSLSGGTRPSRGSPIRPSSEQPVTQGSALKFVFELLCYRDRRKCDQRKFSQTITHLQVTKHNGHRLQ